MKRKYRNDDEINPLKYENTLHFLTFTLEVPISPFGLEN